MALNYGRAMYFLDMSMQKDYIQKYKWLIDQAPLIIEKEYKDFVSKTDKSENEQYFYEREDDFAFDNYLFQNQIKRLMYSSLFVSMYSFFEHKLGRLCKRLQEERELVESYKSVEVKKGSDLEKCYIYLEKNIGLPFNSEIKKTRKTILDFKEIRNMVVHHKARADETLNKKLQKLIDNDDRIEIIEGELEIKDITYIEHFCTTTLQFMNLVMDEYDKLYPAKN